ncbi:MAG: 2Fe-2S iron-sulfur cluster-binding protein [Chloroflexota bacterium]
MGRTETGVLMQFTPLQVLERHEEIEGACSLVLEKPHGFDYKAGQHLPIRFIIKGKEARRTYTLSSSPIDQHLQITVKRVQGGLVSNHINDNIHVGDLVEARPPIGHIFVECAPTNYQTVYLFAAGSGITPMWSMARTLLAQEPHTQVYLFYGNQSEDTIIFRQALEKLQEQYGERLGVAHALSEPKRESWSALWREDVIQEAYKGWIDGEKLRSFLDVCRPKSQNCSYYICGPGGMNSNLRDALLALQVPTEDIHIEYFKAPEKTEVGTKVRGVDGQAEIKLDGQAHSIFVPRGKTLLQAALDAGLDAPYSCEAGICATCRARLLSGKVDMPSAPALEQKEMKQGIILTCQSWANSAELAISYD